MVILAWSPLGENFRSVEGARSVPRSCGDPASLLRLSQKEVDALRVPSLRPFQVALAAPNQVALYLFRDGSWVIENFNDVPAEVEWNGKPVTVAARGWLKEWR